MHGRVERDGRRVEAIRVGFGADPAALGGVVGEVEEFEEELVFLEGEGEGRGLQFEGLVFAGEGGEGSRFFGEEPLAGLGWVGGGGHGGFVSVGGCRGCQLVLYGGREEDSRSFFRFFLGFWTEGREGTDELVMDYG